MKLTRITSNSGRLTKEIGILPDGTIAKKSATYLKAGRAERINVESFSELATLILALEPTQAVIHADYRHDADSVPVVTADKLNGSDAIARTKDHFYFPATPTTVGFDYDGDAPISVDDWLARMHRVWPGFNDAGFVHVPSASGGLSRAGRPVAASTGMRIIFGVEDASDVPRFSRVLFDRAWLAGFGEIFISKAGTMSERCLLFDLAVFSPERLDYLAAPVITSDEITRDVKPNISDGALLDTRSLLDLTDAEAKQVEKLKSDARKRDASKADHIRQAYIDEKADEIGVSRRVIESRLEFRLLGSDVLRFDRGAEITVAEVLLDPGSFHGETLRDPIEPEKGKNKARLYFNRPQNEVRIFSHVHGGQEYVLRFDAKTLADAFEKLDDADEFAELFHRADLTAVEAERFKTLVREKTGLTKRVIDDEIRAGARVRRPLTHGEMAQSWLDTRGGLVFADGDFWEPDSVGIWQRLDIELARREIAKQFADEPGCRSHAQYKQIAESAADIAHIPKFFEEAPLGVAAPSGFGRLVDGTIEREDISPEHRQRFMLPCDPERGTPSAFLHFLDDCFGERDPDLPYDRDANVALVQEIFGAIIFGTASKYERAVMFKGAGNSGKSTLLRIVQAMLSRDVCCSIKPHKWDHDYHAAGLAGKLLNTVGETGEKPLGDAFKEVLGRDTITGRFPYGRPFQFLCPAAHVFNANEFPPTRYRDSAFWRRWLIVPFFNSRADDDKSNIRDLDAQIIESELAQIVAWSMTGAERLEAENGFTEPKTHKLLLREWQIDADSVAAWLDDPDAVTLDESCSVKRGDAYKSYRGWCIESERRALGRNKFFHAVENLGYMARRVESDFVFDGFSCNDKPGAH